MALPSVDYTARDLAADVLHRVVREHLQTFLVDAAHLRDGEGVPRFVEQEFQAFLSCGWSHPTTLSPRGGGPGSPAGSRDSGALGARPSAWSPSRARAEASVQAVAAGA